MSKHDEEHLRRLYNNILLVEQVDNIKLGDYVESSSGDTGFVVGMSKDEAHIYDMKEGWSESLEALNVISPSSIINKNGLSNGSVVTSLGGDGVVVGGDNNVAHIYDGREGWTAPWSEVNTLG